MRDYLLLLLLMCFGTIAWSADITYSVNDSAQIDTKEDTLLVCLDSPLELSSTPADAYAWSPAIEITDTSQQTVTISPTESRWYYLTATVGAGEYIDSVYLAVIDPSFELIVSTMDTICPEERVDVSFDASAPITSVTWEPADGVIRPDDINGTPLRPLETTEYIVTVQMGNCERSDTFTINVVPFALSNQTPDTIFLCKPDSVILRLFVSPTNLSIDWSPLDGTITPLANGTRAEVVPEVTTLYTATATFEGCTLQRETLVRVDSLPDLEPLTAIPFKDPYCAGDSFWIIGPAVDTALYPDLTWSWQPMDGQIVGPDTPGTTGNVRVIILDTTTFIRTATNNACEDTSTILINAIPPEIPLSLNDTSACPGEQFIVEVLDPDVMDLEWEPATGLSCSDCRNPTVTVQNQQIMYMLTGNKEDCPVTASLTVSPLPTFTIPVTPQVATGCEGDQVQLTIDTFLLSNLSISISGGNGSISCTDCPDPIVTIGSEGGIINISADVPDSLGCGAFAQIPYMEGQPEPDNYTESLCAGEPTEVDLTSFGIDAEAITSIDGGGIANCDGANCIVTISPGGGVMTVNSDDGAPGFCGKVTTITFLTLPGDGGEIMALDSMPYGQGQSIMVQLEPPGPDGTDYEWFVNGELQDDMGNPATITFPTMGNMAEVKVIWTNSNGCMEMATVIYPLVEPDIQFPNAFTPNGDDTNERFRPRVTGPAVLDEMLIFNRWGQVVYEGDDPDGWDGRYKGENAPAEVYVYLAKFRFPNGDKLEYKGDLTLIR